MNSINVCRLENSPRLSLRPSFLYTLAAFTLLLGWDFSGLDLWLARWSGSAAGFPLESHWFWRGMLHEPMRNLGWLLELSLMVGVFRPFGVLARLPLERRLQLALTPLLALLAVAEIKLHSQTSCPWDLQDFGGMAPYVPHWVLGVADGGTGGCFPAGHASTGFAFLAGFLLSGIRCRMLRVDGCWPHCWRVCYWVWRSSFVAPTS